MAIYRTVQTSFWTDTKVEEEFTPEDKYFYLYLFTNPHNNLSGCYKLGTRQASKQIGYNEETVLRLLERFEEVHKVIKYNKSTKELLLINWHKYNWTRSSKYLIPLQKEIEEIENLDFQNFLKNIFNDYLTESLENARVKGNKSELERLKKIPYPYGMHTSNTNTSTNTITSISTLSLKDNNKSIKDNKDIKSKCKDIIDYLNAKAGKSYRTNTPNTVKHINARLGDGYTVDDFKKVIDTKVAQWLNDKKMSAYLRPDTLFGSKFESYLNEVPAGGKYSDLEVD